MVYGYANGQDDDKMRVRRGLGDFMANSQQASCIVSSQQARCFQFLSKLVLVISTSPYKEFFKSVLLIRRRWFCSELTSDQELFMQRFPFADAYFGIWPLK